jgi:hypothetical protein
MWKTFLACFDSCSPLAAHILLTYLRRISGSTDLILQVDCR